MNWSKVKAVVWLFMVAAVGVAGEDSGLPLTNGQREIIADKVVPAYRAGNSGSVMGALSPLYGSLEETQLAALDAELTHHGLPPCIEIMTDARLGALRFAIDLPTPSTREAVAVLQSANDSITQAIEADKSNDLFQPSQDRTLASFEDFERIAWESHVYRNELQNASNLTMAAGQLQTRFSGLLKEADDFEAIDDSKLLNDLFQSRRAVHEHDLELRVERLRFAVKLLRDKNATEVQRMFAACSTKKDGDLLEQVFQSKPRGGPKFHAVHSMNGPKKRREVLKLVRQGRDIADDRMLRSEHLMDGLHWWFRGRYGRSTLNQGLLKPADATKNPRLMLSLMMPKSLPRPTDPAELASMSPGEETRADGVPDYDRRHRYVWSRDPPKFASQSVGLYFL